MVSMDQHKHYIGRIDRNAHILSIGRIMNMIWWSRTIPR